MLLLLITSVPGQACEPPAERPGISQNQRFWIDTDTNNCSCPRDTLNGVAAKVCSIPMPVQRLPPITVWGPSQDTPAYPAYEIDRKEMYGRLRNALGHSPGAKRWLDVGANLGVLSISLALANPNATGVALEPNPTTFAFLQRNIAANGLAGRITAVHAGLSADGKALQMPRCVVQARGGSQMASTQWRGGTSTNTCFSPSCRKKQERMRECMQGDPCAAARPPPRARRAAARPPRRAAPAAASTIPTSLPGRCTHPRPPF